MSSVRVPQVVLFLAIAVIGIVIGSVGTLLLRDTDSPRPAVSGLSPSSPRSGSTQTSDLASLVVTAQREADVRISVDGEPVFEGQLQAGESVTREGPSRVEVWTNNAQGVSVIVNGHELGPLAEAIGHPDWKRVAWMWPAGWNPLTNRPSDAS